MTCLVLLAGSALGDPPPKLTVSLNKLSGGRGYTVAATLSSAWRHNCHASSTDDPPDLAWSSSRRQDPPNDDFTASLHTWDGDVTAKTCRTTSWSTPALLSFGGVHGVQRAGRWYFQVALSCPMNKTDRDCVTGLTYTNVVALTIP